MTSLLPIAVTTRSQAIAQVAFSSVSSRVELLQVDDQKRYRSFARAFPTLIHSSGLAQASAFALAKNDEHLQVLSDLAAVLGIESAQALQENARTKPWQEYILLTRNALQAASWIKRYAEALIEEPAGEPTETDEPGIPTDGGSSA